MTTTSLVTTHHTFNSSSTTIRPWHLPALPPLRPAPCCSPFPRPAPSSHPTHTWPKVPRPHPPTADLQHMSYMRAHTPTCMTQQRVAWRCGRLTHLRHHIVLVREPKVRHAPRDGARQPVRQLRRHAACLIQLGPAQQDVRAALGNAHSHQPLLPCGLVIDNQGCEGGQRPGGGARALWQATESLVHGGRRA